MPLPLAANVGIDGILLYKSSLELHRRIYDRSRGNSH